MKTCHSLHVSHKPFHAYWQEKVVTIGVKMGSVVWTLEILFAEVLVAHFYDRVFGIVVEHGDFVFTAHLPYCLAHLLEPRIVTIPWGDIANPGMWALCLDVGYQELQGVPEHSQRVLVVLHLESIVVPANDYDIVGSRLHLSRLGIHCRTEVVFAVVCSVESHAPAVAPIVVVGKSQLACHLAVPSLLHGSLMVPHIRVANDIKNFSLRIGYRYECQQHQAKEIPFHLLKVVYYVVKIFACKIK